MAEAIENAGDATLKALNKFRRFQGNHEDFIAYNRAFHSALAHASGNRRMAAALCDLIGQADRLVRVSVANVKGHNPAKLVAEHVALIEAMQKTPAGTEAGLSLFSATRHLERIADHATNIAEDVVYLISGDIIKHRNPDRAPP